MSPSPRGRGRSFKWLALAIATILTISVIEVLPRLHSSLEKFRPLPRTYVGDYQSRPSQGMVADPVTGWRLKPRLVVQGGDGDQAPRYETNADGFRGADFDPTDRRRRIVLVGDSFTFGVGVQVEETFGAVLDKHLEASVVYNLAMPGFGLDQMWLSARHQAPPLAPALVVVTFISESFPRSLEAFRVTEGWTKPVFKLVEGKLVPKDSADRPGALVRFLERNSVVWRVGTLAARATGQRWAYGESWRLNSAILRQIRDDLREAGIPVLFVFMPTYYWRTFPAAVRYLGELGVDFIDLSSAPGFDMEAMYFPGDNHMNAAGHAWVGRTLAGWIEQRYPALR